MRPVCDDLKAHVPEIVREWEAITQEEPWSSLPAPWRIDRLPEVAIGLFEASLCDPADERTQRSALQAAVEHGEQRRTHGFPDSVLLTEYYLLREAIWRYLKRSPFPMDVAGSAILRVDSAIMLATRATLMGYHRAEYEEQHRWPLAIDVLARESPLLQAARDGEIPGEK